MAEQGGVITRHQALGCGLSSAQIAHRVTIGDWIRIAPGLYRAAVAPWDEAARQWAALLAAPPGSVFSHHTAARLHGLDIRPRSEIIWLTVPHERRTRRLDGVFYMRSRRLEAVMTSSSGHPVTTIARTLIDLVDVVPPERLTAAAFDALRERRVTLQAIMRTAQILATRHSRPAVRRLIEALHPDFDSGAEADADALFRHHGLYFDRQHRVIADGRVIARFDFADPQLRLGIEIDGAAYHASAEAQQRDRRRDQRLMVLGWKVVRFTAMEVLNRPDDVVARLRRILTSFAA